MLDRNDIRDILADTALNGGGTFNPHSGLAVPLTWGYWVASTNQVPTLIVDEEDDSGETLDRIADQASICAAGGSFLGTWIDGGKIYVDCSSHVADVNEALSLAKERGELAIWDIANIREIRTGIVAK